MHQPHTPATKALHICAPTVQGFCPIVPQKHTGHCLKYFWGSINTQKRDRVTCSVSLAAVHLCSLFWAVHLFPQYSSPFHTHLIKLPHSGPCCSPPHCCCCFLVFDCQALHVLAPAAAAAAAMEWGTVGKAAGERRDEVGSSGALLTTLHRPVPTNVKSRPRITTRH